ACRIVVIALDAYRAASALHGRAVAHARGDARAYGRGSRGRAEAAAQAHPRAAAERGGIGLGLHAYEHIAGRAHDGARAVGGGDRRVEGRLHDGVGRIRADAAVGGAPDRVGDVDRAGDHVDGGCTSARAVAHAAVQMRERLTAVGGGDVNAAEAEAAER